MLLRRATRAQLARAKAARAAAEFGAARRILEPLVATRRPPRAVVRQLAELHYLLGDDAAAEALFERARDRVGLALVHYRTNRYDTAPSHAGLPISMLMTRFGDEPPYAVDWGGAQEASLPFVQTESWELPTVGIEVEGQQVEAWIDTGGDMLTLPHELAAALDVAPLATFRGAYAGGAPGDGIFGRLESVRLGPITVRNLPVATAGLERAVLGTGFLSQFQPTLDYPAGRLVLRPRTSPAPGGVAVPFALAGTHLMLVRGSFEAAGDLTFLVDSGLLDEHDAAFAAPAATLAAAGVAVPETAPEGGGSGAGEVTLQVGRFPIGRLGVGPLAATDLTGIYGVFPEELGRAVGIPIHGLVSHHFLRRYVWTIDFARMTMVFA